MLRSSVSCCWFVLIAEEVVDVELALLLGLDLFVRRVECIKAIKVFEESEKKIRMDPDISKLIRTTEK